LNVDNPPIDEATATIANTMVTGLAANVNHASMIRRPFGAKAPWTSTVTYNVDVDRAIYIVFDLETTGFSKDRNYVIDIACEMVSSTGDIIPNTKFAS
jgi:DNA polymerase III epsilon subunit-like protein